MARKLLFVVLALSACSRGAQADLPYIGEARSLAAEWALVNDQASQGKLTDTYTRAMRHDLREQLQTAAKSLSGAGSLPARCTRRVSGSTATMAARAEPTSAPRPPTTYTV